MTYVRWNGGDFLTILIDVGERRLPCVIYFRVGVPCGHGLGHVSSGAKVMRAGVRNRAYVEDSIDLQSRVLSGACEDASATCSSNWVKN